MALYVLGAVQALAGIERDYAMAVSTLLQTLAVCFALCAIRLAGARHGELALRSRTASFTT